MNTIFLIIVIILQIIIIGIIIYQSIQLKQQSIEINQLAMRIKHPLKNLSETIKQDISDPRTISNFMELIPPGTSMTL